MKEIIGAYAGVKFQQINGDNFSIEFQGNLPRELDIFVKDFADLAYKSWRKIQEAKIRFIFYEDIPMKFIELLCQELLGRYALLKKTMEGNGWEVVFNEFQPTWLFMGPEDKNGHRRISFCSFSGACWFQPTKKE